MREHIRRQAGQLVEAAWWKVPLALASAALAAAALGTAGSAFALASQRPDAAFRIATVQAQDESLEVLRAAAAFEADARSTLARRLLDRFEAAGNKSDLREALHWIARDWDQQAFQRNGPVDRKVVSDCERVVLRWYWVCDPGE